MATFFLLLIYITFISLGLPDSILGAAWPVMRIDLGASLGMAGLINIIVTAGTVISSLFSEIVLRRFGTAKVTVFSVFMTAAALLGAAFSQSVLWMMVIAVPLGLGAGAIDTALNNYVALHYKPRHMNWLHSCWGIGAFAGPLIMAAALQQNGSWRTGYLIVGGLQSLVFLLLFFSLPLWRKQQDQPAPNRQVEDLQADPLPTAQAIRLPGLATALLTFFFYSSIEVGIGLWGSSFLTEIHQFTPVAAASTVSLFFVGITAGRILAGFLTMKFKGATLILAGALLVLGGTLFLQFSFLAPFALLLTGLGAAPIFPGMIQETPRRFGAVNSQKIVGWQMACSYTGSTLVPPVLGLVAGRTGIGFFPWAMTAFALLILFFSSRTEKNAGKGIAL